MYFQRAQISIRSTIPVSIRGDRHVTISARPYCIICNIENRALRLRRHAVSHILSSPRVARGRVVSMSVMIAIAEYRAREKENDNNAEKRERQRVARR